MKNTCDTRGAGQNGKDENITFQIIVREVKKSTFPGCGGADHRETEKSNGKAAWKIPSKMTIS